MAARGSNQVTLTFAGDSSQLEKSFDRVGASANEMGNEVRESGRGFDRASEATDALDTKAMGFRDTVTGVGDSVRGFSSILKGDLSGEALFTAGAGVGDLASGFTNLLVPSMKSAVTWIAKTRVGMLAQAAASKVVAAATTAWSVAQRLVNAAMRANPIGAIITIVTLLVGAIILAWKNSETFRNIVKGAWEAIWSVIQAVWKWLSETLWPGIQMVWSGIVAGAKFVWEGIKKYFGFWRGMLEMVIGWLTGVWDNAKEIFGNIVGFVKDLPDRIRRAASGMWDGIKDAFRGALNWIIDRWNSLSFTLPSISVFGQTIGGMTLSTPNIPRFHQGGVASGAMGREFLAVLRAGERVIPSTGHLAREANRMPNEFVATAVIDLGGDIRKEIELTFQRKTQDMRRREAQGAGRAR